LIDFEGQEMSDNKIKFFERAASHILSSLYRQFPETTALDPSAIWQALSEDDNSGLNPRSREFDPACTVSATIAYLIDEGFVRGQEAPLLDGWSVFSECRLSERGFKLLASVPATVDPDSDHRRPGERLADAVEGGKWTIVAELLREIFALRPGNTPRDLG
jgi:hypothetical protein